MKSKLYIFLFSALSLSLFSCKTASKMYEKGNYDEAVELAAKKLQKDPGDQKLLDIIQTSYRYAVNDHENQIRIYNESSSDLKWERIYNEYVTLQKMYDAIYKVPSVFNLVHPVHYGSYLTTFAEKAGEARFNRGLALMERYDKKSYQQAYREFQLALHYKPGNVEFRRKLDEAYDYAVTNVIIQPMQRNGGYVYSSYNTGIENLDDILIRNLQFNSGNEFVKFYSAWDARSHQVRIDQELELTVTDMRIGNIQDYVTSKRVSKEIVVKETVYKPDSVVMEYATVYADLKTTRRTMASEAVLQMNVRNENGRWIWSDMTRSQHNWSTEVTSFTGDKRALSESDKQLLDRRPLARPSQNEIAQSLVSDLTNDALYRIKNYFSRY